MLDLLRTAVVDITTMVATCHALKSDPADGGVHLTRGLRNRLRRDIKCGCMAYIDTLARTRRGMLDEALLRKCRLAAERQMADALTHQDSLAHIMASEAGALDGLAAARQDLWRLANVAIYLNSGMVALRKSAALLHAESADALAARLRRRLRRALLAYARSALRTKAARSRLLVKPRKAALAEIGPRGAAQAERLEALEAAADASLAVIRQGVMRPLRDLMRDWRRDETTAD